LRTWTVSLDSQAGQFPCPQEDPSEHGAVEAAGIGVAQGRMISGEKMQTVGEKILGAVGEAILGLARDDAGFEQEGQVTIEGDLSEGDDDTDARQGLNFSGKVGGAVADLLGARLVARRGAAYDRGYPGVAKLEAVVAVDGARFVGEAEFVQDRVHEVAGAVAGEGSAGTVGTVGPGGEAEDEDSGPGVAKARDGAGPVGLIDIGAAFGLADSAAVFAEARAALAGDDGSMNLLEELRRTVCVGECHCIP
jgi:hypothetical protein